jgi:hypothetical protein
VIWNQAFVLLDHVFAVFAADQTLDRIKGPFRIGDRLPLGRLANQHFTVLGESNCRRRCAITLSVLNDPRLAPFHQGDAGVRCTQVNADNLAHDLCPVPAMLLSSFRAGIRNAATAVDREMRFVITKFNAPHRYPFH